MMLDRQSSRRVLAEAEQAAYAVLGDTPDGPVYVPAADKLARLVLQLTEYLSQLDSQVKTATPPAGRASATYHQMVSDPVERM